MDYIAIIKNTFNVLGIGVAIRRFRLPKHVKPADAISYFCRYIDHTSEVIAITPADKWFGDKV